MQMTSLLYLNHTLVYRMQWINLRTIVHLGPSIRVNVSKTKYMITKHAKGSNAQPCELTYQNDKIEQVNSFKYLGIEFCQDGNTNAARNDLYKRGLKAYFKLVRSLKPLPKPSILLHLFDHLIKPILLYGCDRDMVTIGHSI